MNKLEISTFIEEMGMIGDEWNEEQVKGVFGDMSLEDALKQRKAEVSQFMNIIGMVINRQESEVIVMKILGVNSILKWCQVLSNGRRYTCNTKKIDGELFFYFKKAWHKVSDYASEFTTEMFEEGGKNFLRKFK